MVADANNAGGKLMLDAGCETAGVRELARVAVNGDSQFGLLLIDANGQLIISNREAAKILAYPDAEPNFESLSRLLGEKLNAAKLVNSDESQEFVSGRRLYICHLSELDIGFGASNRVRAVIMTRKRLVQIEQTRLLEKFSMTPRECETVNWLLRGMSGKEIAAKMDISPHTVKVFIRQIMVKMNVSSRVEIVAKVLNSR
jgi:DNA-binding CsgD family transcriptional regulator